MIPTPSNEAVAVACAALASPVRRAVLARLFQVEPTGVDARALAVLLALAPHAALSHLNTLVAAGLACAVRVDGATVYRGCIIASANVFSAILGHACATPPCAQSSGCDVYVAP